MAIKYNNNQVKVVKFKENDVKKIIKDGTTVWVKPYTLTEYSLDNSVVTYKRKTTYEPAASVNTNITKTDIGNLQSKAEVYHDDVITLNYNTDKSKGAVADIVRVDGVDTASGSNLTISKNVEVEVIAEGKPAVLNLTMDLGADYAYVRYIDTDGQRRTVEFDEATTHTISNIWQGTTVEYWWYTDAGHTPKSGVPADCVDHTFVAAEINSISLETTLKPVELAAYWDSDEAAELASVEVRYTDVDGNEQTRTMTSPGTVATNVKFGTQYYWKINPKTGSEAVFNYLEDYDVAEWNYNSFRIDVDWKPCRIRIDWTQLAEEVSSVKLKYKHAEYNGFKYQRLYRNSSYSDVENARCGSTAQLIDFWFTKTGCRVDPLDPDAYKTLSNDPTVTNIFKGLTVEVLDLDERETPVSFTVPSDYEKVEITYINTEGKEVTVEVTGGSIIEDMAEGSYIRYSAITSGGTVKDGFLHSGYDWGTGTATGSSITIPSPSRPARPDDDYVYTWNEDAWAWEKILIDDPRRRTVNITINENVGPICMHYYDVDSNNYLRYYSGRDFYSSTQVTALAGRNLRWHAWNWTTGGQVAPQEESFSPLRESKNPLTIAPTWTLTYGSIHLVFGDNINTITVKYYNTIDTQEEKTFSYIDAVDGAMDITDAVLGKYFTWSATSRDGAVLDRDHGSGYADPDYQWVGIRDGRADRCAIIAPEVDTEPIKIYFRGDYADWMSTRLEAAFDEQLIATYNGSSATIECKTADGFSRWINQVDRLQDTDSEVYTGDASFDKTFPIILNSTTAPWNDSTRKYELRINTTGYSLIDRYQVSLSGTGIEWKINNETVTYAYAFAGDHMSVSGTTLTCRMWGSTGAIRWQATASKKADTVQYKYTGTPTLTLNPPTSVSNNFTYTADGVTETLQTYTISWEESNVGPVLGATSVFLANSSSATSGSVGSGSFNYGDIVYCIVKMTKANAGSYTIPNTWTVGTSDSSYTYYVAGRTSTTVKADELIIINSPTAKTWKVTLSGNYVYWTSNNKTVTSFNVYTGCKLSVTSASTLTCKDPGGTTLWDATVIRNTDTAQYSYSGIPEIEGAAFFPIEVTADTTITAIGATRSIRSYSVTLSPASLTAVNSLFLSENNMATTGAASGAKFDYNKTVYGIARVPTSNLATYTVPSDWIYKQTSDSYAYYTVGSVKVDGSPATGETISVSALTVKGNFTITLDGTGLVWKQGTTIKTSMTAYKNDVISRVNSTTIACSYTNAGGGLAERWRVTVSLAPATNTTTYSGTPSIPTFSSWTVTSDKKLSALFTVTGVSSSPRKYTVTWKTQDGTSTYETDSVEYNTGPDYNGATPGKTATAQYKYTFAGWATSTNQESGTADTSLPKVTSNVTYYAAFSKALSTHTVTWRNWDGTLLETDSTAYGTKPDYNGSTPTKSSTEQYTYQFAGWSTSSSTAYGSAIAEANLPAVSGAVTYYAIFKPITRSYTVTWKNADGTVLETDTNVAYGTTPTYNGSTPTKAADTNYTYTFKGWSPSVSAVKGDTTYTATYNSSTRTYTITFKESNAAYWSSPTRTAYAGDTLSKSTSANQASLTCNYQDSNGNLAQRWKVSVLVKPATAQYTYKVNNWDFLLASSSVTGDMTVTAPSGSVTTNKYTVKIVATTGVSSTFISTSSTATSGTDTTSGASMAYSTTTYYGFVKVANSTVLANTMPTTWEHIGVSGSYTIYKVWSGQITGAINYNPGTMTPITGTVTVSQANYMSGIYLSTSPTTAPGSGSASGSTFNVGTTVYAIAMFNGTQYSAILTKPSTWGSVSYNGTYYYCSVGSITVTGGVNTITYTAPTLKPKLSAPSASIRLSGSNYIAEIHNNANVTASIAVTWYNASTNASLGSATVTPGPNGTATTSLALTTASSVYVKAYATASGYLASDTTTSVTYSPTRLTAPTLISEESTAVSDTAGQYDTCCSVTYKNSNNIYVNIQTKTGNGSWMAGGGLAAGSSKTNDFFVMSGTTCYVRFVADGYLDSDYISVTASSGSSGGGDTGRETTV